jgi:dienelactone hydrolase
MDVPPTSQPIYLDGAPEPVFATMHRPRPQAARDVGVLLCPPFGWDEICCYRSLRFWAARLAQDGYPSIRLSPPGTGDSGGSPRDPDRVGAASAAVRAAASWLRHDASVDRVVAIGIGLGGVYTWLAISDGAPIDDIVLWGTPARARKLLRQLRAFAKLERAQIAEGSGSPSEPAEGEIEAGGFIMTSETVARLEAIDLEQLALPAASQRRAMLLERDGLSVDQTLLEHLRACGATVTVAPGPGFADMTSHPQLSTPPLTVIDGVRHWLDDASELASGTRRVAARSGGEPSAHASPSAEIRVGEEGLVVRETAIAIEQTFGQLSAVLTEPLRRSDTGLCVVLLNPGAGRRIGPNRMWVEAARRWTAQGISTLRLDVEGIGDADGDETPYRDDAGLYAPTFVPQVLSALDYLQARGVGERFMLGGLCSGAYWSFHAALADPRVCGTMLLNPRALVWEAGLGPARDFRALFSEPFSPAKIRRLATGPRLHSFLRWALATPGRWLRRLWSREPLSAATDREIDAALDGLIASGKHALFLFSEHEPLDDELTQSGRALRLQAAPNVTFERLAVRDHTMRPSWAQQLTHAALDRAVALEMPPGPAPAGFVEPAAAPASG